VRGDGGVSHLRSNPVNLLGRDAVDWNL